MEHGSVLRLGGEPTIAAGLFMRSSRQSLLLESDGMTVKNSAPAPATIVKDYFRSRLCYAVGMDAILVPGRPDKGKGDYPLTASKSMYVSL